MYPLIRLYALYALFAGVVTGRLDASEEVSGPSKRVGVAAVVVSNRGGAALEGKQASVEDQVSARLGEMGFRVISREIVQGNLRGFAPLSAPHTKESSTASAGAEAAFLDQASALSLAQNLNADCRKATI